MSAPIDRAFVEIVPDLRRFGAEAKAGISRQLEGVKTSVHGTTQSIQGGFRDAGRSAEGSMRRVSSSVHKAGKDGEGAFHRLRDAGKEAFKSLGGAKIAGVFAVGGLIEFGKKSTETYETITKESLKLQRTMGGTVKEASEWRGAMQLGGVSADQFAISIRKMSQEVVKGTQGKGAFAALKIAVKDAHGQLIPMGELLPQISDKFKAMAPGAVKNALAVQLFGRSGLQMLPFLNRGAKGMEELRKKADELGIVIGDKDAAAVRKSIAAHREAQAAMEGLQIKIGRDLVPAIDKLIEINIKYVIPTFQKVFKFVGATTTQFKNIALAIFAVRKPILIVAAVITTLLLPAIIAWGVAQTISMTQTIRLWIMYKMEAIAAAAKAVWAYTMTSVAAIRAGVVAALGFARMIGGWILMGVQSLIAAARVAAAWLIAMGPIGWVIAAVIGIVTLIVLNWGKVERFTSKAWKAIVGWVVGAFHTVVDFIKTWAPRVLAVMFPFISIPILIYKYWGTISGFFKRLLDGIGNFFFHWRHVIADVLLWFIYIPIMIVRHWSDIVGFFRKIWRDVSGAVVDGITAAVRFVAGLPAKLLAIFVGAGTWLLDAGKSVLTGLSDGIHAIWDTIWAFLGRVGAAIIRVFAAAPRWLLNAGKNIMRGLWNGLRTIWFTVTGFLGRVGGAIIGYFRAAPGWLLNAGKAVMTGLWNGIKAIWRGAKGIAGWISGIPSAIANIITGYASTFIRTGGHILSGIWQGIKDIWEKVKSWFHDLPGKILSLLGIKSPPQWAIDAGMHMMKGILKGIVMNAGGALGFMDRWQHDIQKKARGRFDVGIFSGLPNPFGGSGFDVSSLPQIQALGSLASWITQAAKLTGVGPQWYAPLMRRIQYESGGNPRAINLTDSNARAGHPSMGIMQMIQSTFGSFMLPGHRDIWNPVDNIASAIRYILSRYGSISAIDPPVQGYRTGAWSIPRDQLALLHHREMVIPAGPAEQIRRSGGSDPTRDLVRALSGMAIRFDGDGLARLVTLKQDASAAKGPRR